MNNLTTQLEAMRAQMRDAHRHEMAQLEGLDRALFNDDVALRRAIEEITAGHARRRGDILAALLDLAAKIGQAPAVPVLRQDAPPALTVDELIDQGVPIAMPRILEREQRVAV